MLWESIAEENCMDCTSFQKSPRNRINGARRALMHCTGAASAGMDMAVDELSFYDDEHQTHEERIGSPALMGLLSPEGSPQRFQIVQKSHDKFLQPTVARQLKLQNAATSTSSSSSRTSTSHVIATSAYNTSSSTTNATPARSSFRVFNSLSSTSSMESSMDDDYMEFFDMESLEDANNGASLNFPSNLNSLISGQIKHASPLINASKTPEMRRPSVRRCLSLTENTQTLLASPTQKTPELLRSIQESNNTSASPASVSCFKRPEPPVSASCSPVQNKRHCFAEKENALALAHVPCTGVAAAKQTHSAYPNILRKCMSMNDAEIMSALARSDDKSEPELIGDFSKAYVLPLIEGRHRDLKSISSHTVARLLRGDFDNLVASYKIIDCRYPYEFEGGHIEGAKNLYTQEQIMEEFLTQQKTEMQQQQNDKAGQKRNIIIFHCEFSSERGPKMSRFLRNIDRARNTTAYPALDYPEIYLLHNGYKEFYETHAELCNPNSYRPMLEPGFNEAYRHFRAKSKSWNGDGSTTGRLKKSRSRLML